MASLEELRAQLGSVDDKIVELYEERMKLCEEIGICKIENGYKTFDRQREKNTITDVMNKVSSDINKKGIGEVYEQLLAISRKLQYKQLVEAGALGRLPFIGIDLLDKDTARVVFQGTEGAYSQAAMEHYFGKDCNNYHVHTFREAMEAIEEGAADYAVLPIENSSAGAVTDNYDLLLKYDNVIVAETFLPVHHYLLGTPDAELSDVKRVYAHPQALMQSSDFLNQHDWQQLSMENNAVAAQKVRDEKDPSQAAVAGEVAGEIYGLKKLAGPINNCPDNTTRFLILAKDRVYQAGAEKISLCFELPHRSGTLYSMLGNFIFNDVNMRMIESRPIPEESWQYRFFVDIEGNLEDAGVQNALYGIMREAKNVKILGNY